MKKARKQKKKKKFITVAFIVGIFIGAVISEITGGIISWVYTSTKEFLWPPKLELSMSKLYIYRTDHKNFPCCELNIVAYNHSNIKTMTVELKHLRLFHSNALYYFKKGEGKIRVEPEDIQTLNMVIRDKAFEYALKIPQDSISAMVELSYKNLSSSSIDTLILSDDDVLKCTYLQRPIFSSENEALDIGAIEMSTEIFFTDTLTTEHGKISLMKTYTNQTGLVDFNMKKFARPIFQKEFDKVGWDFYAPAFRRKYGGYYLGYLASDTQLVESFLYANNVFGNIGDYDEYNLVGTKLDEDFANIKEFILYTFYPDTTAFNMSFRLLYENCKYFILLIYENSNGIDSLKSHLRDIGYRVSSVSTGRFGMLKDILFKITPEEKIPSLAKKLNSHLDSLNYVTKNNGFLIFFPAPLDSKEIAKITEDIAKMTNKSHSYSMSFDCRPYPSILLEAPFSTPAVVFLNFSRQTMDTKLDSMKVRYH